LKVEGWRTQGAEAISILDFPFSLQGKFFVFLRAATEQIVKPRQRLVKPSNAASMILSLNDSIFPEFPSRHSLAILRFSKARCGLAEKLNHN
jgi:hypothetical protein